MENNSKKLSLMPYLAVYFTVLLLVIGIMIFVILCDIYVFLSLEIAIFSSLSVILFFVKRNDRVLTDKEITEFSLKVFFILLLVFSLFLALFLIYLFYFASWIAGTLLGLGIIFVVGFWVMLLSSIGIIPILSFACLYFYKSVVEKSVSLQEGLKKIQGNRTTKLNTKSVNF